MDEVARAYATLGLARGSSADEVKRAYRRLARRWHPDRHATDPQGQAEAAVQMRAINRAVQLVAEDLARARPSTARRADPGRALTREELDSLVRAVGTPSPVTDALDWLSVVGLLFAGLMLLSRSRPPGWSPPLLDVVVGVSCLGLCAFQFIRQRRRS